jgi:hypothetical protein
VPGSDDADAFTGFTTSRLSLRDFDKASARFEGALEPSGRFAGLVLNVGAGTGFVFTRVLGQVSSLPNDVITGSIALVGAPRGFGNAGA